MQEQTYCSRHRETRRRYGLCKKCGGTGSRQVLGSKTVHRTVRALRTAARNRKD